MRLLNPFHFLFRFVALLGSLGLVLLLLVGCFFVLAWLLYLCEHGQPFDNSPHTFADALYLSAVTALTVGYGDLIPHSVIGRCLSLVLALQGITLTGIFAAAAVKALETEYKEMLVIDVVRRGK